MSSRVEIKNRSIVSTVWLIRSLCPSVCGWYVVEYSKHTPSFSNKAFQKVERNLRSLSDIMIFGKPQSASHSRSRNLFTHSIAVYVSLPGTSATCLENLSVIDMTAFSKSLESGKANMKSIISIWKGTGRDWIGCRDPYGWCLWVWNTRHSGQYHRNCHICFDRPRIYHELDALSNVLSPPGWPCFIWAISNSSLMSFAIFRMQSRQVSLRCQIKPSWSFSNGRSFWSSGFLDLFVLKMSVIQR